MKITKITADNYKSFNSLEVNFDDFTLIIGANAAGKSNLMSLFKFIKDIMIEGLDNAIALQGGIEYLSNANADKGKPIKIGFILALNEHWLMRSTETLLIKPIEISYLFEITPNKRGKKFNVSHDELTIKYECFERIKDISNKKPYNKSLNEFCSYSLIKKSKQSKYEIVREFSNEGFKDKNINMIFRNVEYLLESLYQTKREILLFRLSYFLPPLFSEENLIKVYDFDPQKLKRPCTVSARKVLESDGSNLAASLQSVLKSKDEYAKFIGLLNNSLPFVNKLVVERNYDPSYSYKIGEKFSNKSFYANFLSDGTVSIIAIIIALYFQEQSDIVIIEEPERNIHPKLLSSVVQMAKDVAQNKQVIFTTHNPEILNNANLESIRFVQRDKFGYSIISKPADSDRVKTFISNELGLSDLFLQNLLGD